MPGLITRPRLPDISNGYELNPAKGFFSVVVPAGRINKITNPSLETNATGYTAVGGSTTLARTAAWQTRGAYGLQVTPGSGVNDGVYYGTVSLTAAEQNWFHFDFQAPGGLPYKAYFASTGATQLGNALAWVATGRRQRLFVQYRETASNSRRLYVVKNNHANTRPFYLDGLLCEAGEFPTTYLDGDQRGIITNFTDYYWTGTPHASTSVRVANSAAGGEVVDLRRLGFKMLSIIGLGLAGIGNQFTPLANGGAYYGGTIIQERQFTLVGEIGGADYHELGLIRQGLIDAINPSRVMPQQPLKLLYTPCDDAGTPIGETLEIPCVFEGGLEGQIDNLTREKFALSFTQYLPFVTATEDRGASIDYQDTAAFYGIGSYNPVTGVWSNLSNGTQGSSSYDVLALARMLNNGGIYAGGNFGQIGGVAATRIAKRTGTTWQAMGSGFDNSVSAIAEALDGSVIAGGGFLNTGATPMRYISRWTGAAWTAMGTATGTNGYVAVIVVGADGKIYVGGQFTQIGGVAANRVAYWDGVNWVAMSTGFASSQVKGIAIGLDGTVYAGGVLGSDNRVCRWTGSAWVALGTANIGYDVNKLLAASNGLLYAGGGFNGGGYDYVAVWNGVGWTNLAPPISGVYDLVEDTQGNIWAFGYKVAGQNAAAFWNGSVWNVVDLGIPDGSYIWKALALVDGEIILGNNLSGATLKFNAVTAVNYQGAAPAAPVLTITGPGKVVSLRNFTAGSDIFFDLDLSSGEIATLDLGRMEFKSNFRNNLLSAIAPGSNVANWKLVPGQNSISVFIEGTTDANTAAVIFWKTAHMSIDGALYR